MFALLTHCCIGTQNGVCLGYAAASLYCFSPGPSSAHHKLGLLRPRIPLTRKLGSNKDLNILQESDGGEKSDGDLVVDVGNEDEPPRPPMAINGDHRDSTGGGGSSGGDRRPPSNLSSSSRSTPSAKNKEGGPAGEGKPGTPSGSSKPTTPNGQPMPAQANGKPPTPGMPGGYPPGFPLRPGGPGGDLPLGYPYQNGVGGVPPGLPGAFPPRPPLPGVDPRLPTALPPNGVSSGSVPGGKP